MTENLIAFGTFMEREIEKGGFMSKSKQVL